VSRRAPFDRHVARQLEAVYATPAVVRQRRVSLEALAPRRGERVLDIGCGPGFLLADISRAVGRTGRAVGVDLDADMLSLARRRCAGVGGTAVPVRGDASALPFADAVFDAAVSTQVYEYVGDVARAIAELHRVLRPGGRVLIVDTDWDSIVWNAGDAERMRRVLGAFLERFTDAHLPRSLSRLLTGSGLEVEWRDTLVLLDPEYDANTYSVTNVPLIADFVVGRRGITREEVEAWARDLERLGEEGRYFFSLNRYLFLARKPRSSPSATGGSAPGLDQ
jgi:arsenite methyltransferase